jgi:excisionase family DNA binding protein
MTELMRVDEVANLLRVDDTTVRRWIKLHVLDAVCLPGNGKKQYYRVPVTELHKLGIKTPGK